MSGHVVVVGGLNIDLVVSLDRLPEPGETVMGHSLERHAGGKGLNQAVAAARLGSAVIMVGALGDDSNSQWLRDVLNAADINDAHVMRMAGTAGTALIEVDAHGENRIVVVPGANSHVTETSVRDALTQIEDISALLVQGELSLDGTLEAIRIAHERSATVIVNTAPVWEIPDSHLKMIDVLIANEHEAKVLTGLETDTSVDATEAALRLNDAGCSTVIITRGEKGCVWSSGSNTGSIPTFRVTPVDTVGAGDAFCGALAAAMAEGLDVAEALRWASAAGALATTKPGAVPSLPHRHEVEALLGVED